MSKITPSQALDEILLDIAIAIESSDRDRAITDRRYKKLNEHLTKLGGELSPYLTESGSVIFSSRFRRRRDGCRQRRQ